MKQTPPYKELSLLAGIVVAGIILMLFALDQRTSALQPSGTLDLTEQLPGTIKLFIERASLLLMSAAKILF